MSKSPACGGSRQPLPSLAFISLAAQPWRSILVIAGLCFFDDAEAEPMPAMLIPLDWETVKSELRNMVRETVGDERPRRKDLETEKLSRKAGKEQA
jgi:hypothetical protein